MYKVARNIIQTLFKKKAKMHFWPSMFGSIAILAPYLKKSLSSPLTLPPFAIYRSPLILTRSKPRCPLGGRHVEFNELKLKKKPS